MTTLSPRARLIAEPGRFSLDQAVSVVAPGGDPLTLRYRTVVRLGYPLCEVSGASLDRQELTVTGFGLVGPGGVLPRHYTATVATELSNRSGALHHFLDMLSGRFIGLFVLAGARYRPARDPTQAEHVLEAAIGLATPHLVERSGVPKAQLLFHAGHLASRTRSATRLKAMLEEETGHTVTVDEFAGGWLRLPNEERTRLGGGGLGTGAVGQHSVLGAGAVLGAETWEPQSRAIIRIGPLNEAGFEALLPGQAGFARVAALARLFGGLETGFIINPILAAAEVPSLRLGGARLGWSSWLTAPRPRQRLGAEPRFDGTATPPPSGTPSSIVGVV